MTAKAQLRRCCFLLSLLFLLAGVCTSQTVNLFVSSKAGDRISPKPELQFSDQPSTGAPTFEVNDATSVLSH
jgi:hypothetical protein